jgi:hypothetical protein
LISHLKWWYLRLLDFTSSLQARAIDCVGNYSNSDARLPLNVNDADLFPEMTAYPIEREGETEMTFSLGRYFTCLKLSEFITEHAMAPKAPSPRTVHQAIQDLHLEAHQRWFRFFDASNSRPFHRFMSMIGEDLPLKMQLIIYNSLEENLADDNRVYSWIDQDTGDDLLANSVVLLKHGFHQVADEELEGWGWFLRPKPWFTAGIVLAQMEKRLSNLTILPSLPLWPVEYLDQISTSFETFDHAFREFRIRHPDYMTCSDVKGRVDKIRQELLIFSAADDDLFRYLEFT